MYDIKQVKEIRKKLGLTQSELAKKAGVSQSLIAKVEAGTLDPTYSNAKKIFAAFDMLAKKIVITVVLILLIIVLFILLESHKKPELRSIKAVYYIQPYSGNYNFWSNLDFELAKKDFKQIKEDGFNSIILLITWGKFQEDVKPITYNDETFEKLDRKITNAYHKRKSLVLKL